MRLSTTQLNKILTITLYVTIVIIFELLVMASDNVPLNLLALISLILLILSLFIITKSENNILSFRNVFMVLSFVFHLGQVVLIFFGYNTVVGYDMRGYTNEFFYNAAVIFTIRVHIFLFFGMMIGAKPKKIWLAKKMRNLEFSETNELKAIFFTGIVLFTIGILPRLYIDISKTLLFIQGNYSSTRTLYFSGMLVIAAGLANTGVLLMIVGKQKNKALCKCLIAIALIYNILYMVTGSRGESVITIFMLTYVYYSIVQKIKIKNVLIIGALGYVFLAIITFVAETRHLVDRSTLVMLEAFVDSFFKKSPVIRVIAEFGVTIKTVFYSIEYFPSLKNYQFGVNYLKSIFVVFPNVGGVIRNLVMDLTYIYYFPTHSVMGGSYIGEMYYAAGSFGVIFAFITGVVIGKINNIYWASKESKNWLHFTLMLVILKSTLWWIRDYFYVMVREVLWVSMLLIIIYKIVKGSISTKKKA